MANRANPKKEKIQNPHNGKKKKRKNCKYLEINQPHILETVSRCLLISPMTESH